MNPNQRKAFHKEAKQSCFCISSKIHGVLTAHQASSGMTPRDKQHAQEYHYFSINNPQTQS